MAFRDELGAARARAEALQKRVRELEEELARAKGETTETGPSGGKQPSEVERLLRRARLDAIEASEDLKRSPRRITVMSLLRGLWFLIRFAFRAGVLLVGLGSLIGGIDEIRDAAGYRPPQPVSVSVESLGPEVPGGLVRAPDSVCLLSELTYLGTLGEESTPECYFPLLSRSEWLALRRAPRGKAGHPAPDPAGLRVIVARRCDEIEAKFGPVLVPRGQVPRRCTMRGELLPLDRADEEVRAFVRREYRGVPDDVLLFRRSSERAPSTALGVILILVGLGLATWMAARLVQMVRSAAKG